MRSPHLTNIGLRLFFHLLPHLLHLLVAGSGVLPFDTCARLKGPRDEVVVVVALSNGGIPHRTSREGESECGSCCRREKASRYEVRVTHDVLEGLGSLRRTSVKGTRVVK